MRSLLTVLAFSAALHGQIVLSGDVTTPRIITTLDTFPKATVTVIEKDKPATYTGVSLFEILQQAGAPFDQHMQDRALHKKSMISSLLVTAKDGYRVVFSLAELDPKNGNAEVLVITQPDGSFSLLASHSGSKARNVKNIQSLRVFQVTVE